jgi:hypothetical protein
MASRKEIVERELGVRVPAQYAAFLEKYGIYHTFGVEVYGISDSLLRYDGIPCVIGATELYRRTIDLPHRFLVLYHSGYEDEMICLDTEDEKVYSISWTFGTHKFADSFDEWFQTDILDYVKERDQRLKDRDEEPDEIIYLD